MSGVYRFVLFILLFCTLSSSVVYADVGTSTADTNARAYFNASSTDLFSTLKVTNESNASWYVSDWYKLESKHLFLITRALLDTEKGNVVADSRHGIGGAYRSFFDDTERLAPISRSTTTGELIPIPIEDVLGYALATTPLTTEQNVFSKSLLEGEQQIYYVFDIVRYDQYSQKTYFSSRLVVDPYYGFVVQDSSILKYFHARAGEVPDGFDQFTKEYIKEKRSLTSDVRGISNSPWMLASVAVLIILGCLLPFVLRRWHVSIGKKKLIDGAFMIAFLAQLGLALYLFRYKNDQSMSWVWLLMSAMGTFTTWISTRNSLQLGSQDQDIRVLTPKELPTFKDVGGLESVKKEIRSTVGVLTRFGDKAAAMGMNFNGILLYGPPGVGKSYIARATAGEFGLNFISVKVSDVITSVYGGSTQMLNDLFKKAIASSPCVLFFDEFDSIAQNREGGVMSTEDTRVVNQLLVLIEDVRKYKGKVILMAATNEKDDLDEAIIRPGRFDRHIHIPLPDVESRTQIIKEILEKKPVGNDIDLKALAQISEGMSAADLTAAIEKALFEQLDAAATLPGNAVPHVVLTQAQLVASFRNLFEREKLTLKKIGWDDIILPPETLQSLKRLVKLVEDPELTKEIGIDAPKGVLLSGPPGTGKTTIARIVANEANASFYSLSAPDIYSKWLGESEKKIQKVFANARKHKPSIIFIDEIDAIMTARGGEDGQWTDKITNQILQEIDGIHDSSGLFVIGATNRPQLLDPALLRGGRLSEKIEIPAPGPEERARLFELYLSKSHVEQGVDIRGIATQASGLGGADIKTIAQQAIMNAFDRDGKNALITQQDLSSAVDKVVMGSERKSLIISPEEKKATAYHEAGHALVASILQSGSPVQKITIVARGHALGFMTNASDVEKTSYWHAELKNRVAVCLGGYAAEKLVYGDVTTGPSSDLVNASNIARSMVTQYGMSEKIGPVSLSGINATSPMVDEEVRAIVREALSAAEKVLTEHRTALDAIAIELCSRETLEAADYQAILKQQGIV